MTAISFVILISAAGASSRFGAPKALAQWGNGTLLSHAVEAAASVANAKPLVVLGAHAEKLRPALGDTESVFNPDWAQGLGTSIACGANAALIKYSGLSALAVLPIDQPRVTGKHLGHLIHTAVRIQRCAVTRDNDIWGPPAAIPATYFPILQNLTGNQGLKSVLKAQDCIFCDAPGMLDDIDTPENLDRLRSIMPSKRQTA